MIYYWISLSYVLAFIIAFIVVYDKNVKQNAQPKYSYALAFVWMIWLVMEICVALAKLQRRNRNEA
jgi:predicted membrane protein